MEPQIQYAKTSDGVNIAYWTLGEGLPFVEMPAEFYSHIQLEWQTPQFRRLYERFAENRMFIRYDGRGCGLSDRDVTEVSLETQLLDLRAVVDRLGLDKVALLAPFFTGAVAVSIAAKHPELVTHLVLWCARMRFFDVSPGTQALLKVADVDWKMYSEVLAGLLGGEPEEVSATATFLRQSVTPDVMKDYLQFAEEFDSTPLLPKVTVPTLVLHRSQYQMTDVGVAQRIASQIPNARLALLEGSSAHMAVGDMDAAIDAIDDFLGEGEELTTAPELASDIVHTILFTDVEGSTALTERLGDAKARDLLREHERITREALKAHGGSEVKTMGDGFMASFSSATKALECAIAIQQAFADRNESAEEPIKVRIGLNAGEPIAEDEDLFGTAVNMAARICAKAEGGQILAPIVVRELVAGKGFLLSDRGETEMRGFEDPVRLYEVRWRE